VTAVEYDFAEGVARLTLADADRGNPLDHATVAALWRAVRQARIDDAHVVVISARGTAFSVGGDVRAFAGADDVETYIDDLAESLHRLISELHRMDAVVVSVVQGTAAGAGVSLAAAADIVVAADSARFTLAYTRIGLSPDGGSTLLTTSIGLHRALHLALLNPVRTAHEALECGLVTEVHRDQELAAATDHIVQTLRSGSRSAQVAAKRLLRETATPAAEAALRKETLAIRRRAASPDGREGVAAFIAKRVPAFPSNTSTGNDRS
jgi:2-(1,2-epoxy-1,2-dihydrophenyl)acetyl-CoA isomerase